MSRALAAQSLSTLLAEQAMRRAGALAVADVSRSWTYGEVAVAAGQMAAALGHAGVRAGDRVGVHCNKGAEGFIAMHAVVSIGAVAVPLDPGSPAARLSTICEAMQIDTIVSHEPRTKTLAQMHDLRPIQTVLGLAAPDEGLSGVHAVDADELALLDPLPPVTVDPGDSSYIITTSGSTGEPKGMVHTHRSALAYADMTIRTYDMTSDDRVSDIAPHHFDISTHSLWSVPRVGAANVVISEPYQRLPASHSQRLQDEAVTFWYSVPFLLHQLVLRGDLANRDLSALRWVHFGGEVISAEVIGQMMQHCPNARFGNVFGPAETNQCSLAIFDGPPPAGQPLSVGFPLDHSIIRVVNVNADDPCDENLMPVGEMGEMWAHTPQLMEGYWNQPELNARVLRVHDGKRFYRTGDLISTDSHGEMSFYGRVDHQVKVRGFRIELEGVELELEQLDGADHVVVGIVRTETGEDELVAGLLGADSDFNEAEFLRNAASVLPAYAVPTRTVQIVAARFTGSGKLDRRALREHAVSIVRELAR